MSFIWNFVALGLKFYADNFSSCLRRWGGESSAFHFSAERDCKQKHLSCSHGTETQTSLWWHEMPFNSAAGRKILVLTSTRGKKIEKKATFKDYPDKHVSLWGEKNHLRVNLFEKKTFLTWTFDFWVYLSFPRRWIKLSDWFGFLHLILFLCSISRFALAVDRLRPFVDQSYLTALD